MSSYDPHPEELITPTEFRESMRLVRLQIGVPISVLIAMGTNLVCALAIKPGLGGINALYPTLLSPNSLMVGFYWAVLYVLQGEFPSFSPVLLKHEGKRVDPREEGVIGFRVYKRDLNGEHPDSADWFSRVLSGTPTSPQGTHQSECIPALGFLYIQHG